MRASCLRLFTHWIDCALALALDKAGNSKLARIAMIAMTTSNSIRVKPTVRRATGDGRPNKKLLRVVIIFDFLKLLPSPGIPQLSSKTEFRATARLQAQEAPTSSKCR